MHSLKKNNESIACAILVRIGKLSIYYDYSLKISFMGEIFLKKKVKILFKIFLKIYLHFFLKLFSKIWMVQFENIWEFSYFILFFQNIFEKYFVNVARFFCKRRNRYLCFLSNSRKYDLIDNSLFFGTERNHDWFIRKRKLSIRS